MCVEFHASVGLFRLAIKWGSGRLLSRRALRLIEQVLFWSFLGLGAVMLLVLAGWMAPPLVLPAGHAMTSRLTTTDVLVIGGGLAGERCAIEAAAAGLNALILSIVPPRRSHSCAAQGGMQAALGNCVKAAGDNPNWHYLDTVRGSDWGSDQEVARIFAEEAPVAVRELAHFGVPWTRVSAGRNRYFIHGEQVEIEEAEENDGLITHRDFGGTSKMARLLCSRAAPVMLRCTLLTAKWCAWALRCVIARKQCLLSMTEVAALAPSCAASAQANILL